jgi:outer membrane protein assembly factor BamD
MSEPRFFRLPQTLTSVLLACMVVASGCASKPEKEQTEQEIYIEAKKHLDRGNFLTAQTTLEDLETRFPFGRFSEQAQLDMMFAQMRGLDYPGAVTTAGRFLRQNPTHANADYARYIKGLANYWMNSGVLVRRSPANPALRDLTSLRDAYTDFGTLVARHPDSQFTPDARSRMLYLRNLMAEQEVANAWYYVKRDACISALNRAQQVIANYPTAPVLGDALVIASECSRRIGETGMADNFLAVLKTNFPQHARLRSDGSLLVPEGSRLEEPTWIGLLSFGLLD